MKILVLGNGFDVDHDLPTSYKNFLNFCNYVNQMEVDDSLATDKLTPTQIKYIDILKNSKQIKDTFTSFIKDNSFLKYFTARYEKQGNNWIDFEREIKNIIKELRLIELNLSNSSQYNIEIEGNHIIHDILEDLDLTDLDAWVWDSYLLADIHKNICKSFNDIALALEYYITVFVNNTEIKSISPDIVDFNADRVLIFNYSDTYERTYGGVHRGEIIDHVHGLAVCNNFMESNIILGITSNNENVHGKYIEFEKYYQRITKKTGNEYKNWLTKLPKNDDIIEVMFFGHSLDSSDSDIIKDLINNEKSKIKIIYHSQTAFNDIVSNLIEILGKEKLISAVSGNEPKIKFLPQQTSKSNTTAGIEIKRDVRKLLRLYLLGDKEIDDLLQKIDNKIKEEDLSYFYNQYKAIDLFDALRFVNVKKYDIQTFLRICEKLDFVMSKDGLPILIFHEQWGEVSSNGDYLECDVETKKLVDLVNKSNDDRAILINQNKPYAYFKTLKTSKEIKNALIEVFSKPITTRQQWKDVEIIIEIMNDNPLFGEALTLLKKEDLTVSMYSKLNYFVGRYEVYYTQIEYQRQMSDLYSQE